MPVDRQSKLVCSAALPRYQTKFSIFMHTFSGFTRLKLVITLKVCVGVSEPLE